MLERLKLFAYRLLRRGEKLTGTDNVYLAKSGFWLSAASAIGSVSSFALALLFARFVPKIAYGTYQYALSWGSILTLTTLTGVSGSVMRAVAQGRDATVKKALRLRLRWGLIGVAIALAGGAYYLWHGRADLATAIVILGVAMTLELPFASWSDYLVGKKQFRLQTGLSAFETLASFGALVVTMFLAPKAPALAIAYGLAHLGASVFAYRYALRRAPPSPEVDPDFESYGKNLSMIDVFTTVSAYLDRVVVFTFLGATETAIYSFATAPAEQIKGYLKNVYMMAFPKIAGKKINELRPGFFRKSLLMSLIVLAVALLYVLAVPFLYPILFPAYHDSIRLTQIFALSLPAAAAVLPLALFNGHKLVKENAGYQVATSAVNIGLLVVLTKAYGLTGTILARVIGRYFGLALSMLLAAHVFKRHASLEMVPVRASDPSEPRSA